MKLVWNRADCTLKINGITVIGAPRAYPPFPCQAYVEEQDTQLVLGDQTVLKDPGKPVWYLSHTIERQQPSLLGSVLIKGTAPLRLMAVVHDLDQDPSCRPETVQSAYAAVLDIARQHDLISLGLPLLGSVHGRIKPADSLRLLNQALRRDDASPLQHVWLLVPEKLDCPTLFARSKSDRFLPQK